MCSKRQNCGMTLIEVLIAVLVLSVALLGALKLQNEGIRLNADSRYTIVASAYAHDALDALSFDRSGNRSAWTGIKSTSVGDSSDGASAALAWLAKLQSDLPDGKAEIGCSAKKCHVQISWSPPGREQVVADFYTYDSGS